MWDASGSVYIVTDQNVILTKEKCCIKAFDFQDAKELNNAIQHPQISFQKGHRVDEKNHNWILFRQYLSLAVSYMTFVIKDKIEQNKGLLEDNYFDLMPFNYLYNRGTCFTDSEFVHKDHVQLEKILESLEELDPTYIEMLHYV